MNLDFTEKEIEFFLDDHKTIQYDENNILNYINFVLYFQYKIRAYIY